MENVRRISRKYYLKKIVCCWLASYMLFCFGIPVQVARADTSPGVDAIPNSGDLTSAVGASITTEITNSLIVTQTDQEAIMNWTNFDIGLNSTAQFIQPNVTAAVLNRVSDAGGTGIMGALTANGRVFIINPAGIVFGKSAVINVAQLVASSLDIDDADFLNGLPYTFTGGGLEGTGNVTNAGTITAEVIALIGREVFNTGALNAENLVIMAAGDSVLVSEVGSAIAVEVTMPVQEPGEYDYTVNHTGGSINADGDTAQVILAAGDIWSSALIDVDGAGTANVSMDAKGDIDIDGKIDVDAEAGSDALAEISIIAGGDIDIEDEILAEADGDGEGGFNATAQIKIEAGENVTIKNDGAFSVAMISAKAEDGVTNNATVDIDALDGDVMVTTDAALTAAMISAKAENGATNNAGIAVDASGNVAVTANAFLSAAVMKAEAKNGDDNLATVGISAGGDVDIKANGIFVEALVQAEAWNELIIDPAPLPEQIDDEVVVLDLAIQGLTNTATVDITAGQNVIIQGSSSGDAAVKALAHNKMRVDIDNFEHDEAPAAIVNIDIADLQNTAGVTITASGEGVSVEAYGASSKVGIAAEAYNELEIEHKGYSRRRTSYPVEPATVNLTVRNLVNTADIDITADNGNVEVGTDEDWFGSEAVIYADAWNEFEMDFSEATTANLDFDGIANNADIDIGAGYDVEVIAKDGGESGIAASAWNELDTDGDAIWTTTADNITNNSDVTVDAVEGNVEVSAECEGDCSDAYILAEAYNDGDVLEELEDEPENITNTANVVITAGEDVKVIAKDCGDASIIAETWLGTDNTSGVTINADGDVFVHGIDGKYSRWSGFTPSSASIEAIAEDADNKNTANITITTGTEEDTGDVKVIAVKGGQAFIEAYTAWADSENEASVDIDALGNVEVKADGYGSGPPSEAWISAEAEIADNKNTADVTITATAVEVIDGDEVDLEGGNVEVIAKDGGIAAIGAYAAWANDSENTANVTITAVGGDVLVHAIDGFYPEGFEPSRASIEAVAEGAYGDEEEEESGMNIANVTITATATTTEYEEEEEGVTLTYVEVEGGDVKVIAVEGGKAAITATAKDAEGFVEKDDDGLPVSGPSNTAKVRIKATGAEGTDFDQVTKAVYNQEEPFELLEPAVFEEITYTEGGDVEVKALGYGSGDDSEASIKAVTVKGFSNDSDVFLCVENVEVVGGQNRDGKEKGNAEILALAHIGHLNNAYVGIGARGDVDVLSWRGEASIGSMAFGGHTNTAYTIICADDITVEALKRSEAGITAGADDGKFNTAEVDLVAEDDVEVIARGNSEAEITAEAENGRQENNARVGIWAGDDVRVRANINDAKAKIAAEAASWSEDGYNNDAETTVVAGGDILVTGKNEGEAIIEAETANGENKNSAYVGLWADGGVQVQGYGGGDGEVVASAEGGIDNDAQVAVCAQDDVIVASGFDLDDLDLEGDLPDGTGGSATIKAEAEADSQWETVLVWNEDTEVFDEVRVETSADAGVKIVSHNGGVAVIDITGQQGPPRTATIEAEAHNAYYNTADVGVAAGGNLLDDLLPEDSAFYDMTGGLGVGVLVAGIGMDSKAGILAYAHDGKVNTADTVVCAPEIVAVIAYADGGKGSDPFAQIKSRAGSRGDDLGNVTNTAKTQVYAGEVAVYVPTIAKGRGIWAYAGGFEMGENPRVDPYFLMTEYDGAYGTGEFVWNIDNFSEEGDDSASLIIKDYSQAVDCPECDPRPLPPDCPECEEEEAAAAAAPAALFAPVAPLVPYEVPTITGCPELMLAVAMELGITPETIQVGIGNALALNPSIQPCEACAALVDAASILRDEDGSRMAAMVQTFNALAPADAPFTPATAASIATAFEGAEVGTQYASAMEYVDAFVQYVAVLDIELGSPVGDDSVAFVMEKYGAGVTGSDNANIAAFVATRLEAIGQ